MKAISLFCGAGGLDLGFDQAGIPTIWAIDSNKDACATYKKWNPDCNVICEDISKINISEIPNCDIILGGFPCQGFSVAGNRIVDDPRNSLYKFFVAIVNEMKPLAFIGENVKGLLTMDGGNVLRAIVHEFSECGYDVFYQLVNAKDFGVPQSRERVIFSGFRKDLNVKNFNIVIPNEHITLREALKDIPEPKEEDVYRGTYSAIYMQRNRKRDWDDVSYTIQATASSIPVHPSSPNMIKIHSDLWKFGEGETRRFSWQECAAIQTFPKDFEFKGVLSSKYKQIGNAVPVKMANYIAKQIKEII